MQRNLIRQTILSMAILSVAISPLLAQPPKLDIPDSALQGTLTEAYKTQIDKRINYWLDMLRSAKETTEVLEIRARFLGDYRDYDSASYRYTFAQRAAELATPVLDEDLTQKTLKQVNLAIALSQMPQVPIQPALEKLIHHENPAVRYLGWEGYRQIRMPLLAQGPTFSEAMLNSLQQRAAQEKVGPVLGQIFLMIQMPTVPSSTVSEELLKETRSKAFEVLAKNWNPVCERVETGDETMAMACQKGIKAMENYLSTNTDNQELKSSIAQMSFKAAWSSAQAFDSADEDGQTAKANDLLLRECETLFNSLIGKRNSFVTTALTEPETPEEIGAEVKSALFKWATELKDIGVQKPQ